jgi:hypothetical protein
VVHDTWTRAIRSHTTHTNAIRSIGHAHTVCVGGYESEPVDVSESSELYLVTSNLYFIRLSLAHRIFTRSSLSTRRELYEYVPPPTAPRTIYSVSTETVHSHLTDMLTDGQTRREKNKRSQTTLNRCSHLQAQSQRTNPDECPAPCWPSRPVHGLSASAKRPVPRAYDL